MSTKPSFLNKVYLDKCLLQDIKISSGYSGFVASLKYVAINYTALNIGFIRPGLLILMNIYFLSQVYCVFHQHNLLMLQYLWLILKTAIKKKENSAF